MNKKLKIAFTLALITIIYNLVEGVVSVSFGIHDETLTLFGFGVDSFVEVVSGLGIAHMILRMKDSIPGNWDKFEKTALRITGSGFYLLTTGLVVGAAIGIIQNAEPHTTIPGIIISIISIAAMYYLMNAKIKIGKELHSDAILSDAECTRTCFYLSIILLASSGLYQIFKIGYFDSLGSLGVAYYAFKEGREAFEKVRTGKLSCYCEDE